MRRKAILLTTRPDTAEMEELVFALGADLVTSVHQRRPQPDPQLFLGSGKMEEVRAMAREAGVDLVVVNGQLRPGQIFNLQRFLGDARGEDGRGGRGGDGPAVEVYDRTRLILEIFRDRARSPEARLQVELAQLQYDMPLVREAISLSKKGERPGFLGSGEYEVNQLQDMMKKRMARIRRELDKMRAERAVRRKHRRRSGFHLVSLAGYTNAGKSSLLKALAQEHTLVENRYFSTLSTKTARARSDRREILVTDTVGFIEDLPPWMVEAFHSTLEEIALADVILLVLDASDPVEEMARRLRSSLRILWEFDAHPTREATERMPHLPPSRQPASPRKETPGAAGQPGGGAAARVGAAAGATAAGPAAGAHAATPAYDLALLPQRHGLAPILVALNKKDRLAPGELDAQVARLADEGLLSPASCVAVSARAGEGLADLYERLYAMIPDYDEYEVALPPSPESEALIAWLHENADVLDLTRGHEAHVHFEAKRSLRPNLLERLKKADATPLREVVREASLADGEPGPAATPRPDPEATAALTSGEDTDTAEGTDAAKGADAEAASGCREDADAASHPDASIPPARAGAPPPEASHGEMQLSGMAPTKQERSDAPAEP